jgi:hypothetical protein
MKKQKRTAPAHDRAFSRAELAMKNCNRDPTNRQHKAANSLYEREGFY